jgi:TolA-binding protein
MSDDPKESSVPLAEISQGPNAFEAFLDRNQKGIVAFAILLAVGAATLVVYRGIEKSREETAGAALNRASATADYQAVVKDHADTVAAGSARILLADSLWAEGKKDDSINSLRTFLESHPDHPAAPSAKSSLGSKLMDQGKSGDAVKVFEEVAADPTARFIAPFALISLGDLTKDGGDLEKAETYYNRVRTEFADSTFVDSANRRIATLKAKPPVEIEPPPAPAETPAAADPSPPATPPSSESPQTESPPASKAADLPPAPNP